MSVIAEGLHVRNTRAQKLRASFAFAVLQAFIVQLYNMHSLSIAMDIVFNESTQRDDNNASLEYIQGHPLTTAARIPLNY